MNLVKVHLDTDLGGRLDDLCALALLLRWPGVELTGITTVLEDDGRRAGCARYVLALAGWSEVPVAAGADVRLGRFQRVAGLPAEARYWPEPVQPAPGPLEAALTLLRQSIEAGAIVIAIGPCTNLALLEQRWPGLLRRASLYLMGGSIRPAPSGFPVRDYRRDFNVQADSQAARQVIESSQPTLVPLEVTVQTALRQADLPALGQAGPLGRLLAHQAGAFAQDERLPERLDQPYAGVPADAISFQHDPLTCAVALGWPGANVEPLPLALERDGELLRLRIAAGGRRVQAVTAVEGERFNTFWLDTVTGRQTDSP
jgi:inosine-uridine nucleoside N-ribohydrolase